MGTAAIQALDGTHRQLGRLYPGLSRPRLWALEGITLLPGIDDYPKKTEVTYLSDARDVARFARAHRLPLISIWALQRDNGGCPGTIDSNSCSGIHAAGVGLQPPAGELGQRERGRQRRRDRSQVPSATDADRPGTFVAELYYFWYTKHT